MKASENKRKTPSEYYNEYFKRGRPDLLWLIQKPKNAPSSGKRKKGEKGEGDSDDEGKKLLPESEGTPVPQALDTSDPRQDLVTLPKSELSAVRQEIRHLQQQQKFISSVIGQIKRQNDQLYQQASAFQTLHDRHENSINAILTFLATFYNRSLEGHGPSIADMFTHAIPQNMQQTGNVVDVGDIDDVNLQQPQGQPTRPNRRPLALLPAPEAKDSTPRPGGRASTVSPSPASEVPPQRGSIFRPPNQAQSSRARQSTAQAASSTAPTPAMKSDAETPNVLDQLNDAGAATPNTEQMMSVINAANNASGSTPTSGSFDFPAALANYQTANGAAPLTPQQKSDALSMIASKLPNSNQNANNALATSNLPQAPDPNQIMDQQNQLEYLQQLQDDNQRRVQDLAERLTPLSPTGSIPGLDVDMNLGPQMGSQGTSQPPDWDLNNFINSDDYFPNTSASMDGQGGVSGAANPEMDLFDFGGYDADTANAANGGDNGLTTGFGDDDLFGDSGLTVPNANVDGGGKVESVASSGPGSPAERGGQGQISAAKSPKKRRRVG